MNMFVQDTLLQFISAQSLEMDSHNGVDLHSTVQILVMKYFYLMLILLMEYARSAIMEQLLDKVFKSMAVVILPS